MSATSLATYHRCQPRDWPSPQRSQLLFERPRSPALRRLPQSSCIMKDQIPLCVCALPYAPIMIERPVGFFAVYGFHPPVLCICIELSTIVGVGMTCINVFSAVPVEVVSIGLAWFPNTTDHLRSYLRHGASIEGGFMVHRPTMPAPKTRKARRGMTLCKKE